MNHYKSNLRDIEFNLFEYNRTQDVMGRGPFADMDEDTARTILQEVHKLAVGPFADSFEPGDRTPLVLEDGNVTLPVPVRAALDAYYDGDWQQLQLPSHLGGVGAPPSLEWGAFELLWGANGSLPFYLIPIFFAKLLDEIGTESQKARYVRNLVDRRWGATMVLTEPDAGSDVGAARTSAKQIDGDVWQLEGTKRFITNGDFDGTGNIVHFVLARPDGARAGTKGLSLFIVPKLWVDEDGELGERNGAVVTGLEKKMGLNASATCELTLGADGPCRGLLVGNVHDGIRQMFRVIEYARMNIGLKSVATLSTAYLNARDYAKERVQGPDMTQMADKEAPRVRIIRHPDVRRMLMDQKSHVEGMRALVMYCGRIQDDIASMEPSDERAALERRNDLLLPIIKGYCSDRTYELLASSLQVFGGVGFCKDFPIEQYIRDQKIDTLYEGTTHIQALDLFFRKVARDQGRTLFALLGDIERHVGDGGEGDPLAAERQMLGRALGVMRETLQAALASMQQSIYLIGLNANRLLHSLAELVIADLLVRHAALAHERRATANDADRAFYDGKIASAAHFTRTVLPKLDLRLVQLKNSDLSLMELDEAAF